MAINELVWVAETPGKPGYSGAAVDKKDTMKDRLGWLKEGRNVKRVPLVEARAGLQLYLAERRQSNEKEAEDEKLRLAGGPLLGRL